MSVIVQGLTKVYGTQRAVDAVSFQARSGEVLGFLGPNGAGKSTTMKILTGYLPPTEGTAEVAGYNILSNSIEVRRRVGYLPEHNPLYRDMYVREYLGFIANIHKVSDKRKRINTLIDRIGLGREQHKKIGALSKGYRQRVGIAQALLHEPEVLILDEPVSGLDPNQLAEIRELIRDLGKDKTVILSTHIMQEVQAVCDRVLIIDRGAIVADDTIDRLQDRIKGGSTITVAFAEEVSSAELKKIQGVHRVKATGPRRWQLSVADDNDLRGELFRWAVDQQYTLLELHRQSNTVEDVFQQLTK